jgi:hypothetical protein
MWSAQTGLRFESGSGSPHSNAGAKTVRFCICAKPRCPTWATLAQKVLSSSRKACKIRQIRLARDWLLE